MADESVFGPAEVIDLIQRRAADIINIKLMKTGGISNAVRIADIAAVHAARGRHDALVVNPGAFTHYSWALHDALAAFEGPVVELHLSNPQSRERWRHTSVVTPVADAMVCGLGGAGYRLAVDAAAELLRQRSGR